MSRLKIIRTCEEVDELIAHCLRTKFCSFDFETTGFKYYSHSELPLCCGVSFQPGSAWVLPLAHKESPFKNNWSKVWKRFALKVICNPLIVKVAWNFKFEYKWCIRMTTIPKGYIFDAMLAKFLLDEERPNDLKDFVANHWPEYAGYGDEVKVNNLANEPLKKVAKYCGIDADLAGRAMIFMEPKLMSKGFYSLFRNMYCGLVKVFAEAEYSGIKIDRGYLENLIKEYAIKIEASLKGLHNISEVRKFENLQRKYHIKELIRKIKLEIRKLEQDEPGSIKISNREKKIKNITEGIFANKEKYDGLNFNSPPQLGEFLYTSDHGLGLKIIATTDKGAPSTAEDTLKILDKKDKTGFMKKLLAHRTLTKLDSTYISGMMPHLDIYDRVHAGFKLNGTVTSRLSCVEPNLQNIPRDATASDVKPMFIPPPGYLLVQPDYSQAELRLVAEASGDEAMIDVFRRDYNIHTATACKMYGGIEQYDLVKKILKDENHKDNLMWTKRKKIGKSLNFSIVYQQGDKATAEGMTNDGTPTTEKEAHKFKEEWFNQFPKVRKWVKNQIRSAYENGYVDNLFGFRRRLDALDDENKWIRLEAERQAVNAPIQGASGLFTLFSMIVMREKILTGEWPKDITYPYSVHDSIGMYMKPKYIHKLVPEIIKICDNPQTQKYFGFQLKHVFMKVSIEVGTSWGTLKDYDDKFDYQSLLLKLK